MASNQLHGKDFENIVKAALFRGAADHGRSNTATFDVEARFDRMLGLPTSVKTTGGRTVSLADARRFWDVSEPFRMLVCSYRQRGNVKSFHRVDEFIVHGAMFDELRGALAADEVAAIHEGLGLGAFPQGEHEEARSWAKEAVAAVGGRRGTVALNPKIDSAKQRRLQCSVSLRDLAGMALRHPHYRSPDGTKDGPNHVAHVRHIGYVPLPFEMTNSGPRRFRGPGDD